MNEVKSNVTAGVLPERRASSKGGDSTQAQAVGAGKSLPVDTPKVEGAKAGAQVSSVPDMDQAVARMNEFIQKEQRDLQFSIDDATGSTVVQVTDRTSGELIRQIPNQVFLDLAADAIKDEPINLISVYS